eukprot:723949_1
METDGVLIILKYNSFAVEINDDIMNTTREDKIMLASSITNGKLTIRTWMPITARLEVKCAIVTWQNGRNRGNQLGEILYGSDTNTNNSTSDSSSALWALLNGN